VAPEGVALAAIQGLYRQNQALAHRSQVLAHQNQALAHRNGELNARLTRLEHEVAPLVAKRH